MPPPQTETEPPASSQRAGRQLQVRSVGTEERLIKRDPPVGRSLSGSARSPARGRGNLPQLQAALIRDPARTGELDAESEESPSSYGLTPPPAGSTRLRSKRAGEVERVTSMSGLDTV